MLYMIYCPKEAQRGVSYQKEISQEIMKNAFPYTYERMKRFGGKWHVETVDMFPGYLFLDEESMKTLDLKLQQIDTGWQKIKNLVLREVSKEEESLLCSLCGETHHVEMSKGIIQDGVTRVTDGPLYGKERYIRRIDRHKRIARIETPVKETMDGLVAGLEIVSKS